VPKPFWNKERLSNHVIIGQLSGIYDQQIKREIEKNNLCGSRVSGSFPDVQGFKLLDPLRNPLINRVLRAISEVLSAPTRPGREDPDDWETKLTRYEFKSILIRPMMRSPDFRAKADWIVTHASR
jgi:hypothetical protein